MSKFDALSGRFTFSEVSWIVGAESGDTLSEESLESERGVFFGAQTSKVLVFRRAGANGGVQTEPPSVSGMVFGTCRGSLVALREHRHDSKLGRCFEARGLWTLRSRGLKGFGRSQGRWVSTRSTEGLLEVRRVGSPVSKIFSGLMAEIPGGSRSSRGLEHGMGRESGLEA